MKEVLWQMLGYFHIKDTNRNKTKLLSSGSSVSPAPFGLFCRRPRPPGAVLVCQGRGQAIGNHSHQVSIISVVQYLCKMRFKPLHLSC